MPEIASHRIPTQIATAPAYIGFGTEDRPLYWFTDACVVGALILSVGIYYLAPNVCLTWLSTYFTAISVIVLLNIVLLQRVFGGIASPERSLLLFMCNVAQNSRRQATKLPAGIVPPHRNGSPHG